MEEPLEENRKCAYYSGKGRTNSIAKEQPTTRDQSSVNDKEKKEVTPPRITNQEKAI